MVRNAITVGDLFDLLIFPRGTATTVWYRDDILAQNVPPISCSHVS